MEQKNAWIYCHIDAPEDAHGTLKGQYEQLERYAEQMGFAVVGSSQDLGSDLHLKSTGLSAALKAAKAGAFSFLLVTAPACLGHDSTSMEQILNILKFYGVQLYSPLEGNVSAQKGAVQ